MARQKKAGGSHSGVSHERWLITYADLITLLMVFFIIMYAMSTLNQKKYEVLATSLKSAFNTGSGENTIADFQGNAILTSMKDTINSETLKNMEDQQLREMAKKVQEQVDKHQMQNSIHVTINERGLVISLVDKVLFNSGEAELTPKAKVFLDKIIDIIAKIPNQIRVEGHTDNLPISNIRFPSNWELSTARATRVIAFLIEKQLPAEKLSAAGYGEYRPVVPNTSEQNRSLNRRVDIVILRSSLNQQEPPMLIEELPTVKQEVIRNSQ